MESLEDRAEQSTSGRSDQELLKTAYINEKASPEILPFQEDLISRVEAQIDYQEEELESMRGKQDVELLRAIFTTELARVREEVRYLLRSYYRVRLHKIEASVMFILDNPEVKSRLSQREDAHAQDFFMLQAGHLRDAVAQALPDSFSSLVRQTSADTAKDMLTAPDLNRHIFCRVLRDLGSVQLDDKGNAAQFSKDDVFVVRYEPLRGWLEEGAVELL